MNEHTKINIKNKFISSIINLLISCVQRIGHIVADIGFSVRKIFRTTTAFLLIQYFYALLGGELFARYFHENDIWLDHVANFRSFHESSITLFQIFTGSNWQDVLYNLQDATNAKVDWGIGLLVYLYVISFYILSVTFMTNVIMALVWEAHLLREESRMKEEASDPTLSLKSSLRRSTVSADGKDLPTSDSKPVRKDSDNFFDAYKATSHTLNVFETHQVELGLRQAMDLHKKQQKTEEAIITSSETIRKRTVSKFNFHVRSPTLSMSRKRSIAKSGSIEHKEAINIDEKSDNTTNPKRKRKIRLKTKRSNQLRSASREIPDMLIK